MKKNYNIFFLLTFTVLICMSCSGNGNIIPADEKFIQYTVTTNFESGGNKVITFGTPDIGGTKFYYISKNSEQSLPSVSYTHLRAHETDSYLVCRLLLEKKNKMIFIY